MKNVFIKFQRENEEIRRQVPTRNMALFLCVYELLYIFRHNADEVIYCTINIFMRESHIIISIGHGVPNSYRI